MSEKIDTPIFLIYNLIHVNNWMYTYIDTITNIEQEI